ncbi:pPIWI_RE_Z domain-containing protein [Nocardioides sp. WG-D5]
MRSTRGWSKDLLRELGPCWPEDARLSAAQVGEIELGLHLLQSIDKSAPAMDLWPLLSGYPYAQASVPDLTAEAQERIDHARYYLSGLRRRHVWETLLTAYVNLPQQFRGFDLISIDSVPERREPSIGACRFDTYEAALASVAATPGKRLPMAGAGEYRFSANRTAHAVTVPPELVDAVEPARMPIRAGKAGEGAPIVVTRSDLLRAAEAMDAAARTHDPTTRNRWTDSFGEVEMAVATMTDFSETPDWELTIGGLFHLVGMVGAGKSTIMHLLTYHCVVQLGLKVTVVVGDVAESLRIATTFNELESDQIWAAPIVGRSTRERHIQRLHMRKHSAGAVSMLAHSDPAFNYLSSACPLDGLRGFEDKEPLRINDAPCERLLPVPTVAIDPYTDPDDNSSAPTRRAAEPVPHGCPLWNRCPRHRAARELVDAPVWVATMPSLLHARLPKHQCDETIRYLEAAADRSDLIIIDEADRVQTQLDSAFAPAETLIGSGDESWIDLLQQHAIRLVSADGRKKLTNPRVSEWIKALDLVHSAADSIYIMLNASKDLRDWVGTKYFSTMTLHQELYNDWVIDDQDATVDRDFFESVLNQFRDRPVQHGADRDTEDGRLVADLVDLTNMLLSYESDPTRLDAALAKLTCGASTLAQDQDRNRTRFTFTLLVAALDNRLNFVTSTWPTVEAELELENTANSLTRRPPRDYEPVMAESPMGNVLGYQFTQEVPGPPPHSGSLRFFHCNGVGRDLLRRLPDIGLTDDSVGPHVLLMSGTSWAGTSTRYHLNIPVSAILKPKKKHVDAIRQTAFKREPVLDRAGEPIRISGNRHREAALKEMLDQLAIPDENFPGATSTLAEELEALPDGRKKILLLTGSYAEANTVANYLHESPAWKGNVTQLIPDDAERDDVWRSLRRGDVASYASMTSQILVAPLLAVERGHNIVLDDGTAAIGSVYFLVRPHDRPDDINLAIHAINDWAIRFTANPNGPFYDLVNQHATLNQAADDFRRQARLKARHYLTRSVARSALTDAERRSFDWDQMVTMWQVIGRLVRGGVAARVKFCDAAFFPQAAAGSGIPDTARISLLSGFEQLLKPYFDPTATHIAAADKSVATALFQPFWDALIHLDERE